MWSQISQLNVLSDEQKQSVLSDEQKRAAYDRGGMDLVNRRGGPGGFNSPFDFFRASQMFNENFGEALAKVGAISKG